MYKNPSPTGVVAARRGVFSTAQVWFQVLVLGLLVLLLLNYKGLVGLQKIRQANATGGLRLANLEIGRGAGNTTALGNAAAYLKIVWPALVFGVLISAAMRTSLARTPLHTLFRGKTVHDHLTGVLAGAPLMLCSCCAAPIFPAVYERTRKIAPALAMTLASPSLNPAALILSFILFPWRIAGGRLLMALVLVLLGSLAVAKISPASPVIFDLNEGGEDGTWPGLLRSYADSLFYVSLRAVPLIMLGTWVSMWIMLKLPSSLDSIASAHALTIIVVALFAVLLTLPSLFEIPLALAILAAGGPAGAAAVVLFAGPAINLPSLLVIGRCSTWKIAVALATAVWIIAVAGGMLLG